MTLTATLLALMLAAVPTTPVTGALRADTAHRAVAAHGCLPASETGTFRVTTQRAGAHDIRLGLIVLENIDGCLAATYITDGASPAAIDKLSMTDGTLHGALRLASGAAAVSLHVVGATIDGSIVEGHNAWSVVGRRTS